MRATLSQDDTPDGCPADDAGLAMAMIDAMKRRKAARLAAGVAKIGDGAAVMEDCGPQDGTDAFSQGPDLLQTQRRSPPGGSDAGAEKRLVRIDVPDAGDFSLVEEKWLDPDSGTLTDLPACRDRESGIQRFHPDPKRCVHGFGRQEKHLPELPDIPIRDDSAPGEAQVSMGVAIRPERIPRLPPQELTRHPETHDQALLAAIEEEELPASAEGP